MRCAAQYQRKESLQFIPGRMHQQDVMLDQVGTWLVQCRTTNHFDAGMDALLNVTDAPRKSVALFWHPDVDGIMLDSHPNKGLLHARIQHSLYFGHAASATHILAGTAL